jgi:hypothetical protein
MKEELKRLEAQEDLDAETWQYLEATYVCAAGNAFSSMTSSRYGGEVARIRSESNDFDEFVPQRTLRIFFRISVI